MYIFDIQLYTVVYNNIKYTTYIKVKTCIKRHKKVKNMHKNNYIIYISHYVFSNLNFDESHASVISQIA